MSGLKNETKKEISQLIFGLYGNILFLKRKYRGQAKSSSGMYCINKDGKQNHPPLLQGQKGTKEV